ncbi:MAG: hypothetical protein ABI861_01435 [Panacibacter sp.]
MKQHAKQVRREQQMVPEEKYLKMKSSNDADCMPKVNGKDGYMHLAISDAQPKERQKTPLVKRFSPFLMLICLLFVMFPYMMITGDGNVKSFWLLLFLFPFTISNLFFADFAIWKYFSGKKIVPIWLIELTLSILIIRLFI